ncbi:MAG: hypothetical protein KAI24_10935 [Planctomycetes bacterium]|nr:hypothetical protein [Planctomycetota bacterium]
MNAPTDDSRQASATREADDGLVAEAVLATGAEREAQRRADPRPGARPARLSVDPMRSTDRYRLSLPGAADAGF